MEAVVRLIVEAEDKMVAEAIRKKFGSLAVEFPDKTTAANIPDSKWNPTNALDCLGEASTIVNGDRRESYGHPLDNHTHTANLWSAYLGIEITPEQVCMLNILQKISRSIHLLKRDSVVDIIGYAANIDMIQQERERRQEAP